ncbi:MAG: dephospho-CoA kinase [Pseudomonadota bacterium]|jgi:dephospho-CoA kinase
MSPTPKVVAITGGIGSGKSLVAKLFEGWGAAVVDADQLARQVVEPGSEALNELALNFPNDHLILADGSLNRSRLGAIIFANPERKKLVEEILHPRIRQIWLSKLAELKKHPNLPLIAYVVPLYFESSQPMPEIEKAILVTAPEETRIKRVMARDGFDREMVVLRMHAQLPDQEKIAKSDYVIVNDSSIAEATTRAQEIFTALTT